MLTYIVATTIGAVFLCTAAQAQCTYSSGESTTTAATAAGCSQLKVLNDAILTIDGDVTINGKTWTIDPAAQVKINGSFIISGSSKVSNNGTFTIEGDTIANNSIFSVTEATAQFINNGRLDVRNAEFVCNNAPAPTAKDKNDTKRFLNNNASAIVTVNNKKGSGKTVDFGINLVISSGRVMVNNNDAVVNVGATSFTLNCAIYVFNANLYLKRTTNGMATITLPERIDIVVANMNDNGEDVGTLFLPGDNGDNPSTGLTFCGFGNVVSSSIINPTASNSRALHLCCMGKAFMVATKEVMNSLDNMYDFFLPIELSKFSVNVAQSEVMVAWTTESEHNNDYFSVERSGNAKDFETIARIDGAGTSTATINYNFVDKRPLNGLSYYRLKQTDYNGEFSYSPILSALVEAPVQKLSVFKSSVSQITVHLADVEEPNQIALFDMDGFLIFETTIPAGINTYTIEHELQRGVYIVNNEYKGMGQSKKIKM